MMWRTIRICTVRVFSVGAASVCAAALVAGCGSADTSGGTESGGTETPATADGPPIDACALLDPGDVATVIESSVDGRSGSSDPQAPVCIWENPSTYASVTLTIGSTGTAPNNTLPPVAAGLDARQGPDGVRFPLSGMAEFAAGNRLNIVQVAAPSAPADRVDAAATAFAQKVTAALDS